MTAETDIEGIVLTRHSTRKMSMEVVASTLILNFETVLGAIYRSGLQTAPQLEKWFPMRLSMRTPSIQNTMIASPSAYFPISRPGSERVYTCLRTTFCCA